MLNAEVLDRLAGNRHVKAVISDYVEYNKTPHAVIISGEEGTGKHTVAGIISEALGCRADSKPCGKCEACRKISEKISPDVVYITCEKNRKTIGVEAVRTIRESAYIVPNDLDLRIFIIDDASSMTAQAQNALLKLLEEPPENVYFILIAENITSLLTTVRSRAPELRMETFSSADISGLLLEKSEKARELSVKCPDAFARIVNSSQGSFGKALKELASKKSVSEDLDNQVREYIAALAGFSKSGFFMIISSLPSKQRNDAAGFCEKLMYSFRDMIVARKSGKAEFLFFLSYEDAKEIAIKYPFDTLVKMYGIAEDMYNELNQTNINIGTEYITLSKRLWLAK